MRRPRFSSSRALLLAPALLSLVLLDQREARASWPPPPGATQDQLKDPANWPNDPGYGPHDSKGNPVANGGTGGTWQYWSWIPAHDAQHPYRQAETATGMSVDVAWTYSIGDPRVKIAVTDSGIKWDERELVHKAALNEKELVNAKPLTDTGAPCGGAGALAGLDCNGDGVFDMYDYEASAKGTLTGKTTAGPLTDANANGLLDPGDLIILFSDGKDDDGNGYVDDICGWDFFKDDNDPYDDTRYGHGTGEANDSVGEANNGQGGEGVCPRCRFVPLRVGDSFITDVQGFAKAAVYAADNGVSVIQCALGTVNQSNFSRAAIDYAYSKHVTVVTSSADENSRHHNMPAAASHTVVVHAIHPDNNEPSQASTYLNFHPCSNFGGEKQLSASGEGCASEATGRTSGTAGMIYSMALKSGITDLTAEEVRQLLIESADLINVPESYDPNAPGYDPSMYYPSKATFSQRFGYGRLNVGKAMKMIADGKLPPEVDVVSPTWFTVIYKNKQTTDVPLNGLIRAARASTFDAIVEWAPGVEPDEDLYKPIATIPSHPGGSAPALGADGAPLAYLKLSDIPDIDNPGEVENRYAITVRIRATAHYGGTIGDVPGEVRRTYYIVNDPTIVDGWPKYLGASGEGSPRLVDLDGDGKREVLYPTSDGVLHAYKGNGQELWSFKTRYVDGLQDGAELGGFVAHYTGAGATNAYTRGDMKRDLARESLPPGSPAIGDIDGDGKKEIVFGTYAGTLYALHLDGTPLGGNWPIRLPDVPSCPRGVAPALPAGTMCMDEQHPIARGAVASISLADLDKDGRLDVISAAFDGHIYVFHGDGTPLDGWPVEVHYDGDLTGNDPRLCTAQASGRPCLHSRIITTPALGDLTGDGIPDIGVGSNQYLGNDGTLGAFFVVDGRGSKTPGSPFVEGWPVISSSFKLFPLVGEGIVSAGMMADMTGDGKPEVIFHGTGATPLVLPAHPQNAKVNGAVPTNVPVTLDPTFGRLYVSPNNLEGNNMIPVFSQPTIGDLDQDGKPDIIAYGASFFLALALQSSGRQPYEQQASMWSGQPSTDCAPGVPSPCLKMFPGSPAIIEDYTFFHNGTVADVDGDDYPEVIVGTGGYYVRAFNACGTEAAGFPKFTGQWVIPSPTVGDIDGDGKLEVVSGSRDGWVYAWHTEGRENGVVEWPTYHHDLLNTGNYATPIDFPGKKAAKPLDLATACVAPAGDAGPNQANPSVTGGGGCACETSARGGDSWGLLAGLGALGLLIARRRR